MGELAGVTSGIGSSTGVDDPVDWREASAPSPSLENRVGLDSDPLVVNVPGDLDSPTPAGGRNILLWPLVLHPEGEWLPGPDNPGVWLQAVSYTHLTLPTIYSV